MLKSITSLFKLLTDHQRTKLYSLQIFVVLSAIFEVAGIASIVPFMAVVSDTTILESNAFFARLYAFSGLDSLNDFVVLLGVLVLVTLATSTLVSMYTVVRLSRFAAQTGSEISQRLFDYYCNQNWLYFTQVSSPKLVKKISNETQRMTLQVLLPLVHMNARAVSSMGVVIALLFYNPIVTFVGLVTFCSVYFVLFKFVRGALQINGLNISQMLELRYRVMNDVFGGMKDLIVLNRKDYYLGVFSDSGDLLARSMSTNTILGQLPRYAIEFIVFGVVISLVIFLFSSHDQNLTQAIPELSVYALAGLKLLPAVQNIYSSLTQVKGNIHSFNSIKDDLISSSSALRDIDLSGKGDQNALKISKGIEFKGIRFKYPNKLESVLQGIDIYIPVNSLIGIVGASGSGKSTLVDVLMGLIEPNSGRVIVDGHVVDSKKMLQWQNLIGYVPQTIFLSEGSISENVAFGIDPKNIDSGKVQRALKAAHLDEYVNTLPEGMDSCVGERGVQMSGGQRQRIGIARALYHDPSVLVFDEATSALDGITEKVIMNAIRGFQGTKTIIVIAHRLKTVIACSKIYYLDKGCVLDQGTYSELLSKNTRFKEMAAHS
jgi:ATP-binding cassette, subfamily B, bacterial PglK